VGVAGVPQRLVVADLRDLVEQLARAALRGARVDQHRRRVPDDDAGVVDPPRSVLLQPRVHAVGNFHQLTGAERLGRVVVCHRHSFTVTTSDRYTRDYFYTLM